MLSTAGTLFADTALDFDGVDDFLELPTGAGSPLDFGTSAFTIEMWIKATRTGSEQRLVTARRGFSGDDQDGYTISITPTGALEFFVSLGGDRTNTITRNNVADGTWKHIALSRGVSGSNSVSIDLAVDGRVVVGSSRGYTGSSDKDLDIRESTYIGADYNPRPGSGHGKWFSGQIDELRIWNISRGGSSDYDDALTGEETGLIAYYDFEEGIPNGDNTTLSTVEESASSIDGALRNFAKTGDSSNFVAASLPGFTPSPNLVLLPTSRTIGDVSPSMVATSDSPRPISYSSNKDSVATINATTGALTLVGEGNVSITATQTKGSGYAAGFARATLRVKASNSLPTLTGAPTSSSVLEDTLTSLDYSALTFADAEVADELVVTFEVDAGSFGIPTPESGFYAKRESSTELVLSGRASAINSYLDTHGIRYLTAADAVGTGVASLTINASDGSSNPLLATISLDSTATADAPVLDASESPALSSINKNAGDDDGSGADDDDDATNNTNNPGTSIADIIIDGSITDLDAVGGAIEAMAVTAVDNTNGVWQYSTDNGSSWSNFSDSSGEVSLVTASRLLDGSASGASTNKIRYVPAINSTDSATFTFRAWDKASGTVGGTADTTSSGAVTAFSLASDTASISVSGGNALPETSTLPSVISFSEDTTGNINLSALTLSDADDDTLTLSLSVAAGVFSTPVDDVDVTETLVSATNITLQGSAAALNTYLDTASNLQLTASANASGAPYTTLALTLSDGTATRNIGSIAVNVLAVNDAPVLDTTATSTLTAIAEDISSTTNYGDALEDVVDGLISDIDPSSVEGVAITEIDNTNGVWQYNLTRADRVATEDDWSNISSTTGAVVDLEAAGTSRLLRAHTSSDYRYKIRFKPDANFNGTATIKYRAWDMTAGTDGSTADTSTTGGTSAFSTAEETVTVTVTPVNDAPTVTTPWSMAAFTEDTAGDMRLYFVVLSDIEGDRLTLTGTVTDGIIVSVADGSGVGSGVVATKVSSTQFTLEGSIADLHDYMDDAGKISYSPPANVNGNSIELQLRASDGALNSPVEVENIRINAVNDAPVLDSAAAGLSTTLINTAGGGSGLDANNGYTLFSIVGSGDVSDVDGTAKRSIAVTEVDNRYGKWQYSTLYREAVRYVSYYPDGWRDFSSTTGAIVDLTSASVLLKRGSTPVYVRYVPYTSTHGTATLTFRAWDESDGNDTGDTASTASTGGSTPFSTATDTVSVRTMTTLSVENLDGDVARYVNADVSVDVGGDAVVLDDDATRISRIKIDATGTSSGFVTGDEYDIDTSGAVSLSSRDAGATVSVSGTAIGTLSHTLPRSAFYITFNSSATMSSIQTVLRAMVYRNTDTGNLVTGDRTVRWTFRDTDGNEETYESIVREAGGDANATVTASSALAESGLTFSTSRDTAAEAMEIFDFTITDGGGDGLPTNISRIRVRLGGTVTNSEKGYFNYLLDGPDVSNRAGGYGSGGIDDAGVYFSSINISVADGASETYTLKMYRDPDETITDGATIIPSVDGSDSRWYVDKAKTEMGTTSSVTAGLGTTIDVESVGFGYTTLPSEVTSGTAFTVVVKAEDSGGGVDTGFTEDVTLSLGSGAGSLSGTTTVAAVSGVATFTNVVYTAAVDGESFTLTANDEDDAGTDLTASESSSVDAEVVATKLIFLRQPTPRTTVSGADLRFDEAAQMRIAAVGAGDVVDTDFTSRITLSEINGAGSARLFVSSDVGETIWRNAVSGIAQAWPSSGLRYTNSTTVPASVETFNFQASATGLTSAVSEAFSSVYPESTGTLTAASAQVMACR